MGAFIAIWKGTPLKNLIHKKYQTVANKRPSNVCLLADRLPQCFHFLRILSRSLQCPAPLSPVWLNFPLLVFISITIYYCNGNTKKPKHWWKMFRHLYAVNSDVGFESFPIMKNDFAILSKIWVFIILTLR